MDPIRNPYSPGAGSPPPELAGRDPLIEHFGVVAKRLVSGSPGKSLIPNGLRGVGKTVLLNVFERQARDAGAVVQHLEADQDDVGPDALARRLRAATLELAPGGAVGHRVRDALRVIASVRLTFGISGVPLSVGLDIEPAIGKGDSGNLREDLTDLFVAVGEAAAEHKRGVVLCIDEMQALDDEVFRALIVGLHRCSQLKLPVIAAGAGLPDVKGKAGDVKTYAERLFLFPDIGSLDDGPAIQALVAPAQREGVTFEPEAVSRVLKDCRGYPYFLQEWAYESWNAAEGEVIDVSAVERATPMVHGTLDSSFFGVRMGRLTPQERKYLRSMAETGPGPYRSGEVAERMGMSVERAGPLRQRLITKGMVWSGEFGEIAFSVPLFDDYLRRNVPAPVFPTRAFRGGPRRPGE